jgi:hypothetical protein
MAYIPGYNIQRGEYSALLSLYNQTEFSKTKDFKSFYKRCVTTKMISGTDFKKVIALEINDSGLHDISAIQNIPSLEQLVIEAHSLKESDLAPVVLAMQKKLKNVKITKPGQKDVYIINTFKLDDKYISTFDPYIRAP